MANVGERIYLREGVYFGTLMSLEIYGLFKEGALKGSPERQSKLEKRYGNHSNTIQVWEKVMCFMDPKWTGCL